MLTGMRHKAVLVLGCVLPAVVVACGGTESDPTLVPVDTDIPTQTASKIQSEPTVTSILFQLLRLLR